MLKTSFLTNLSLFFCLCAIGTTNLLAQFKAPPEFYSWTQKIADIDIGYGLQIADVDGDGFRDILLADKRSYQWYQYPNWTKHTLARNLTLRDNVCIAARDLDGDGKCEIAVGGQWNFRETMKDGAVFYLEPQSDRRNPWKAVRLYNEPSTHRMHWRLKKDGNYSLIVKPLRGRGSIDGVGPGLKLMEYTKPANPLAEWDIQVISDDLHLSHNFHLVNWDDDPEEELIVAAKEGVWHYDRDDGAWIGRQLTKAFAGEIRDGKLPNGKRFIVTIEPMHGTKAAVYVESETKDLWEELAVLTDSLIDGHALAVADFFQVGYDQIVVGWRAMKPKGDPGIRLFSPMDEKGASWRTTKLSDQEVAVEDIKVGDVNADGKIDIIAAGRQTKNLQIIFNASYQMKN